LRLSLTFDEVFQAQLRALLRAAMHGPLRIMFPFVTGVEELRAARTAVTQAREALAGRGLSVPDVPIGVMIEVPSAALTIDLLAEEADFVSIGTNDLIQYTLAIDRADDKVAHLYDPLHPAVLSLIASVIRTAHQHEKPVAVCGEMAGDVELTRMLLGFGLRHFSMHPAHLLGVKQRVLMTSLPDIAPIVARILRTDEPEKMQLLIEKLNG
jgi:phosphotransferase system enzyme I (PtsI)